MIILKRVSKDGIKDKIHELMFVCFCMTRKRKAYFPIKKCSVVITLKLLYCKWAIVSRGIKKGKRWVESCKMDEKKSTSALEKNDIERKREKNC